jgi:hypothetical protein
LHPEIRTMPLSPRPVVELLEGRLLLAAQSANTFQLPLAVPQVGETGKLVAKGDFNGDGYLDLAITGGTITAGGGTSGPLNAFDGGVQVLLNDRTGRLNPAGSLRKIPYLPGAIVAGDFDGDGATDVAVAAGIQGGTRINGSWVLGSFDGGVYVLKGDGRGGLGDPVRYAVNTGGTHALVLGDFDGDGRSDIAAAGFRITGINSGTGVMTSESQIGILRNAGGGSFFPADETHIAGSFTLSIAPIAYDTDGRTDLAVSKAGLVQFLQSKGDGTFDFPGSWAVAGHFTSVDLNRDGLLDLIGTVGPDGTVRYALARGNGGFSSLVTVPGTGNGRYDLAPGDFNGDGRLDFIHGAGPQSGTGLFLQQADGSFQATPDRTIVQPVLVGDFNNDGRDDAFTFVLEGGQIYLATPPAVFTTPKRTLVINGTRRADTLAVTVSGSRIMVTLNGQAVSARLSRVRRIQITTGLGADTITLDPSVFSPTLISAGGESDTVTGGSGSDTIQGDNGSDVLAGGAGVDVLQGGKGADTLDGGAGIDAIYAGRDLDTFSPTDTLAELLDRTPDELLA